MNLHNFSFLFEQVIRCQLAKIDPMCSLYKKNEAVITTRNSLMHTLYCISHMTIVCELICCVFTLVLNLIQLDFFLSRYKRVVTRLVTMQTGKSHYGMTCMNKKSNVKAMVPSSHIPLRKPKLTRGLSDACKILSGLGC